MTKIKETKDFIQIKTLWLLEDRDRDDILSTYVCGLQNFISCAKLGPSGNVE